MWSWHRALVMVLAASSTSVSQPVWTQSGASATSQAAAAPSESRTLQAWLTTVEQHEPGMLDASVMAISAWSEGDLGSVLRDLKKAGRTEEVNRVLKRGALLHADMNMLVPVGSRSLVTRQLSGTGRRLILVVDGRPIGVEFSVAHLEFARALLDAVSPDPKRDEMVPAWYHATAAYLQSIESLGDLAPHLERALRLFPADANVLLDSGALHEAFAAPRLQAAIQSLGGGVPIKSARAESQQAEKFFRQALKIKSGLAEARVRLGYVIGLQGRHAEAAGELRRAAATTEEPLLLYYAELFLGHEEAALNHDETARQGFERAGALYPRAQSPRLALSVLARRAGDRVGALRAIQGLLRLPADEREREDPWWQYNLVSVPSADALLADVRRPFLTGDAR